jgi:uncharacterized FlaG/YvyC family protein
MSQGSIQNLDHLILNKVQTDNLTNKAREMESKDSMNNISLAQSGLKSPGTLTQIAPEKAVHFSNPEEALTILRPAAEHTNELLFRNGSELYFEVNQDSGSIVTTLMDSKNKEKILQYPSEQSLAVMENIQRFLEQQKGTAKGLGTTNPSTGLLVEQKV